MKSVIPHLLLCIFLLALPAAVAADDDFPEVQFAGAGGGISTNLLPADFAAKDVNEMFGAKDPQSAAE